MLPERHDRGRARRSAFEPAGVERGRPRPLPLPFARVERTLLSAAFDVDFALVVDFQFVLSMLPERHDRGRARRSAFEPAGVERAPPPAAFAFAYRSASNAATRLFFNRALSPHSTNLSRILSGWPTARSVTSRFRRFECYRDLTPNIQVVVLRS